MKTSLQLWSVRDSMEEDFAGTLAKVAAMGYEDVEFAGYFGHTAKEVKDLLEKNNLEVSGSHVPFENLRDNFEATVAFEKEIGNHHIIVPYVNEETHEAWQKKILALEKIGEKVQEEGLSFGYHNHGHELMNFPGVDILDEMYQTTTHINFEVDAYWVAYAKKDVLAWLNAHAPKIATIHMKDMEMVDDVAYSCVLGTGILPLEQYVEFGQKNNFTWLVVEQEAFLETPPLEAAAENAKVLHQLIEEVE